MSEHLGDELPPPPPIAVFLNFTLDATSSVIYNFYGSHSILATIATIAIKNVFFESGKLP